MQRSKRPRTRFESLENRIALAGDLAITGVQFVNLQNEPIGTPIPGQGYMLRAQWNSNGLNSSDSYHVEFSVDGVSLDSDEVRGSSGDGPYYWYRGPWYATPGAHSVTVAIDPDNEVQETNESNNVQSYAFRATESHPSIKLQRPIGGRPYEDWTIINYVDVDASEGISDSQGGHYTYDGHNGVDYSLPDFPAMDAGVDVKAAAAGTVVEVHDGEFDRCTRSIRDAGVRCQLDDGNYVIVDHGNGWRTLYWHFQKNSIVVSEGQRVGAGQRLGNVGSSGWSTGPHLHFVLQYEGIAVDTLSDPERYWVNPIPYSGSQTGVFNHGMTDQESLAYADIQAGVDDVTLFRNDTAQNITHWVHFFGSREGDQLRFQWINPAGSVVRDYVGDLSDWPDAFWYSNYQLPQAAPTGTWQVRVSLNGTLWHTDTFRVVDPQEIDGSGATLLAVNRNSRRVQQSTLVAGAAPTLNDQQWAVVSDDLINAAAMSGDFDNDGEDEVVMRSSSTGDWVVVDRNNSTSWGRWSASRQWLDVHVADTNKDGFDDVVGRDASTGNWWVAVSNGTGFTNQKWGSWSNRVSWLDVVSLDADGDGLQDIAGRTGSGQWWVARSNGTEYTNERWGDWSNRIRWLDVNVGDFNGDGRDDIVGRASTNGAWWVAQSTGTEFFNSRWTQWSPQVNWRDVVVADFDGDQKSDIAGRAASGRWWVSSDTPHGVGTTAWAAWSSKIAWQAVTALDADFDGRDDLLAMNPANNKWYLIVGLGPSATTVPVGQWAAGTWNVL